MLKKRKGSEWSSVYMLIVVAIAAVLLITLVKPLFKQTQIQASGTMEEALTYAKSLYYLLAVPLVRKNK